MACDPNKSWNKGACVPVVQYDSEGGCDGPAGGTPEIAAPPFTPIIENELDLTWRDEDGTPVQADDDDTIWEFDNVL